MSAIFLSVQRLCKAGSRFAHDFSHYTLCVVLFTGTLSCFFFHMVRLFNEEHLHIFTSLFEAAQEMQYSTFNTTSICSKHEKNLGRPHWFGSPIYTASILLYHNCIVRQFGYWLYLADIHVDVFICDHGAGVFQESCYWLIHVNPWTQQGLIHMRTGVQQAKKYVHV